MGASIVVGDAIRRPYQDLSLSSAEGGVVRLDRSGTAWNSFELVLAAASGRLFADGPHQPGVFLVPQHLPVSSLQLARCSLSFSQQTPRLGGLRDSVLIATEGARRHGLY